MGGREGESGPPKRPGEEAGDVMRGRAQQWGSNENRPGGMSKGG
jgi:hypothetical protein